MGPRKWRSAPLPAEVYVANSSFVSTVSVINPTTGVANPIVGIDSGPGGVAVAPTGAPNAGNVYISYSDATNSGLPSLEVLSPTNDVMPTIPVGPLGGQALQKRWRSAPTATST